MQETTTVTPTNEDGIGNLKNDDRPLVGNEMLAKWKANRATLPDDFGRLLDPTLDEKRRGDLFEAEDEDAMDNYAWAIPDERALAACAACSPLIEMGAGAGYWARLLRDTGTVIHAFDAKVGDATRAAGVPAQPFTTVEKGGPEQLSQFKDAALLLIYPDDLESSDNDNGDDDAMDDDDGENGSSLSMASLAAYEGDTVIHVGEWLGDTLTLSMEGQGLPDYLHPWGRSTNPQFQVLLSATFHKVLQLPLPNWGSVRNCLTIWKRTATIVAGEDRYAYIPEEERLDLCLAAPSMRHLLNSSEDK